ncbi:MAG TPA: D-glycerate dehydrogenase [Candidatus Dormibacteraeota bacterium]|nr:D-glycerate dehydrogenase [Candidatus Dormibacteraeota bacterium]
MKEPVFVTYPIPDPGLPTLRAAFKVSVFKGRAAPTPEQIAAGAEGCRGILVLVRDRVDAGLIKRLPKLRAIANYGVGYDNIAVAEATRRGILVTNTPDVLTEATADLTWALMLATARRLGEGERMVRAGQFKGWNPNMLVGADFQGRTLGLVGFGRIARAVARRAAGFRMRLLHTARSAPDAEAEEIGSHRVSLERLLKESDFLSLHVPLTSDTRHLIDETALRAMKKTAYLINTSRGPVVDEGALAKALREGWIAGAGLDVYENEPDLEPGLLDLDSAVLLPHIGSATIATRAAMSRVAATNLVLALQGQRPPQLVNPEAWKGG